MSTGSRFTDPRFSLNTNTNTHTHTNTNTWALNTNTNNIENIFLSIASGIQCRLELAF